MIRAIFAFLVLLTAALTCMAETQDLPTPPQPTAANVATYYVIPIKGGIGSDFTAALMETLLQQAKKLSPTVVVLEIDTGGGNIHDAERIIDLIIANKNLRFVALVRRALSAGAAITLACKEIYLADTATIGGAVSYKLGDDGTLSNCRRMWLRSFSQSGGRYVARRPSMAIIRACLPRRWWTPTSL